MGRVCGKHQQFVQDGEECNYCEPGAAPAGAARTPNPGTEGSTPSRPASLPNFFAPGPASLIPRRGYSESYPEWKARNGQSTAAGRLSVVQELLAPRGEDGEMLPPLVTVDEAKKLLDYEPVLALHFDEEFKQYQQALLDHIEQLKKLVLAAFALPPRNVFARPRSMQDSLREAFLSRSMGYEARYACMFSLAVQPALDIDGTKYEVQAYDGFTDRRGVVIGVVSNVEAYSNQTKLDKLLGAVLAAATRKAYVEMKKSALAAAMEATPPSTREDAHGDDPVEQGCVRGR